jgi:hypothetical protein
MTSDLTLCASTHNLQDFNWQANLDLGAKLTLGIHAYMFKKKLFDTSKTWENRKLFNERTPFLMEYISGNNQQYTIGQVLPKPLKVRVLSKNGFYADGVFVTFETIDNSGTLSETTVLTNSEGIAQVIFTPTSSNVSKVRAYVKDCEFNNIQYAPLIFIATQKVLAKDCSQTTLSASFYKDGNTLLPLGHLGVPPYTYSTDSINFYSVQPIINIVNGQNPEVLMTLQQQATDKACALLGSPGTYGWFWPSSELTKAQEKLCKASQNARYKLYINTFSTEGKLHYPIIYYIIR